MVERSRPVDYPQTAEQRARVLSMPLREFARDASSSRLKSTFWLVLRRVSQRLASLLFERGLDTDAPELEVEHFHPERTPYSPSAWSWLRRALQRRSVKPTDVFVDLGSGKGRVVRQAARYRFGRVIGVEISEHLNQVARANLARNRHRLRCRDVQLITADAAEYPIPSDMTVAYLYQPVSGRSFDAVIDNIIASVDRHPRAVKLIFSGPRAERAIEHTRRFEVMNRHRVGPITGIRWQLTVYACKPATRK